MNNSVASPTSSEEENQKSQKKKEITCYECKNTGHYTKECDEEETVSMSNKKDPIS